MKKPMVKFANVNLNEDEDMADVDERHSDNSKEGEDDDEEEGEDDEFIDVLDILDGRGEIDTESSAEDPPKPTLENRGRKMLKPRDGAEEVDEDVGESGVDDPEEDDDDDDDDASMEYSSDHNDDKLAFTPSDTEDAAPEALDELQNFISALNPTAKKRKALDGPDASSSSLVQRSRKQRRLSLKERTEAGAENEFRAQNSGMSVKFTHCPATLIFSRYCRLQTKFG
jgi:U3 small nucleolar RNA-associated protein 14